MPRHPITDHCCKFAGLERKAAIFPWRDPQRILIQSNLSAMIAGIKATVDPGLRKEINLRTELRIEKQREARIEKSVAAAVDQTGRGLFEMVNLQIERAT